MCERTLIKKVGREMAFGSALSLQESRTHEPGAQFNSDSENDSENNSENDSEILPKSYIKKFKNLKFRHVQKLGRILRIILRIAIELTPRYL